jgi:ABC-type Fe3+ transport system substrate-binding protein
MRKVCWLVLLMVTMSAAQDQLVLVSPHWEGIRLEFESAFKAHYQRTFRRTVQLRWLDVGGTMAILRFIRTSFQATPNSIGVDVFWGGGVDPYVQLQKDGLLQPVRLSPQGMRRLPKAIAGFPLYDPQGHWYGAAVSGFGILVNRVIVGMRGMTPPTTWEDLGKPEWFGWMEIPDPRRSGSAHMMCEIILQAYGWRKGWEVLTHLFANAKRITPGSEEPVTDVSIGEIAAAPCIDFYGWSKIAQVGGDKLQFVYPPRLTVINPDAIAILKGAPNLRVAKAFLEFVLSDEGQKLWLLPVGAKGGPRHFNLARMSVLPHLYEQLGDQAIVKVNPFRFPVGFRYDSRKGNARIDVLNSLLGAFLIEPHRELQAAWRRWVVSGRASGRFHERICRPPVSEEQVMQLSTQWATDRAMAAKLETQWANQARRRYRF